MNKALGCYIFFLTIFIGLASIFAMTIGTVTTPDSFHYMILGKYLVTGVVSWVWPLNFAIPQSIFGPVYALIAYYIQIQPMAMTITPALQYGMLVIASVLLLSIYKSYLPNPLAIVTAIIFLFLPSQMIYAHMLVSEITAEFLIVLYLFVTHKHLTHPSPLMVGLLFFLSSILTLTRYGFMVFLPLSVIIAIIPAVHFAIKKLFPRLPLYFTPKWKRPNPFSWMIGFLVALAGISFIWSWGNLQASFHGKFNLTAFTGRHLFNNVIHYGKLMPPEGNPVREKYTSRLPGPEYYLLPWWDNVASYARYLPKMKELDIDNVYKDLAIEGIKTYPLRYIFNVLKLMVLTPITPPYIHKPEFEGLSSCNQACRVDWNGTYLCRPQIEHCSVQKTWTNIQLILRTHHLVIGGILFFLAMIGSIMVIFKRKGTLILFTIIFWGMHTLQSASEWLEGRFIMTLYPIYAMLIAMGILSLFNIGKKIWYNTKKQHIP